MSAEGYSGGHATSLFAVSKATTAEEGASKGTLHWQAGLLSETQGRALAPTPALSSPRPQVDL